MNFVDRTASELFATRRREGWGVDPVRTASHMTSSQALLLNLFGPLKADPGWFRDVLRALTGRVDVLDVLSSRVEYAPARRSQHLGDQTRVDAYITIATPSGIEALVLELKYTDRFSSRRFDLANRETYRSLAQRSRCWSEPASALSDPEVNQLLRSHALGISALESEAGQIAPTTLLVVAHRDDVVARRVCGRYQAHLADQDHLVMKTLDELIWSMKACARTPGQLRASAELEARYLDEARSEALWVEHLAQARR